MRFEKAISFCLYGDKAIYTVGMKENLRLAPVYYPGWQVVIYHDGSPKDLEEYERMGAHLILETRFAPMFARFLINDIADRWICRDTDCRLSEREAVAVNQWIESGKMWHTMADDAAHTMPVQGAMWGGYLTDVNMEKELLAFEQSDDRTWGTDEHWLSGHLWPMMQDNCLAHHYRDNPIPALRTEPRYVGQAYLEDGRRL